MTPTISLAGRLITPARVIAVLLLVAVGVQTARLYLASQEQKTLSAQLDAANARLAVQDAGLELLRQEAELKKAAAVEAARQAKKAIERAESRAKAIEQAPAPATCEDAIRFLVEDAARTQ